MTLIPPAGTTPPARRRAVRRYVRRAGPRSKTLICLTTPNGKHRLCEVEYFGQPNGNGRRRQVLSTVASESAPEAPPTARALPLTRAECQDGPRPCPYTSCKHHLYLDVNPETGSIKLNFPHLEPWEMAESCSLDVAERAGITLEEVGAIVNLTRERVRQVEVRATAKLRLLSSNGNLGPLTGAGDRA